MPKDDQPLSGSPNDPASPSNSGSGQSDLHTIAFERSSTPMMIAEAGDKGNLVLLVNPAFLALTGYSVDEVVGRDCRFLQGPGTSNEVIAEIRASIKAEREVDVTLLNYRKDGSEFWNKLHISPVRDGSGQVIHYFASQTDVTEARSIALLEASERRLLKEVDHRAKNLMAVVNSIVRLSKSDDPVRYAASVRERVQTLSDVHMLLAENRWRSVALGDLFRQELAAFGSSRVQLDGPYVSIDATDAQPIALIIHELAANAAKFGALSVTGGTLQVQWRNVELGGFEIKWDEQGGTALSGTQKAGFGTVMVDALVERQMRGRIQRDWFQSGLSLVIALPRKATTVAI